MALCPSCGSPVEGRFCAKCGASVQADSVPPGPASPAPSTASAGLDTNVAAALCYLLGFITGIIFLVIEPYNRNKTVRFHAFQSIFVSIGVFVISVAIGILAMMFYAISFWLGSLVGMLQLVLGLGFFILWLYLMWKAYQNDRVVLPVVGPLAEKQA